MQTMDKSIRIASSFPYIYMSYKTANFQVKYKAEFILSE
jgi:hypothetical protein